MPTWTADATHRGRWFANSGNYQPTQHELEAGVSAQRYLLHWTSVPIPSGATVESATLTVLRSGLASSFYVSAWDTDDAAEPASDLPDPDVATFTRTGPMSLSPSGDVAAAVNAALSRPGWVEGNGLTLILEREAVLTASFSGASLSVVWQRPVQVINPKGASFTLSGGRPVDPSYAVNPAAGVMALSGGVVDVIGPRLVGPIGAGVLTFTGGATDTSGVGPGPTAEAEGATLTLAAGQPVTLARTLAPPPPPVPWERIIATPQYLDAITGYEARIDTRVDILDETGTVIERLGGDEATLPGVLEAQVTCDGTAQIRWTGSLRVDNDALVPMKAGDLLHPLTYNRARLWWRIALADGSWAEVPCGTMYLDDASVSDGGGASVSMTVPLSDVAAVIKRAKMPMSVNVGGLHAHEAIRRILSDAAPFGVPMSLAPLEDRLPADYEAGQPDADPWDEADKIARAANARLYVDRMGTVVLEPLAQRHATGVGVFAEGPGCRIVSGSRSTDLDRIANVVPVTSGARRDPDGEELDPIYATWTDEDETSPTWVGRGHIMRAATVTVDEITTQEQADAYARTLGEDLRSPVQEAVIEAYPHPHLDPDVLVPVDLPRIGVAGDRRVTSWSLVMGPQGLQRINLTGRREL